MEQRAALVREVKLVQAAMEAQEKRMREALEGMQVCTAMRMVTWDT